MASGQMKRNSKASGSDKVAMPKAADRKKIMDKIQSLEQEMARTKKRMDNATNAVARQTAKSAYDRLKKSHDKAMAQYDSLSNESSKSPSSIPSRKLDVAPVDKLKSIPSETKPTPKRKPSRPSTVDTESKSLGRRIGESLMKTIGDTRSYEQATKDRKANEEMEREMMGKKKGGMVKKKKGGMASRTLRTNTKAGFTRRGCSKG